MYNEDDLRNTGRDSDSIDSNSIDSNDSIYRYTKKDLGAEESFNNNNVDTDNNNDTENNVKYNTDSDYYWQADDNSNSVNTKKKKKKNKFKVCVAAVAAIAIVGAGIGTVWIGRNTNVFNKTPNITVESTGVVSDSKKTSVAVKSGDNSNGDVIMTDVSKVVENVMPSIVAITSTTVIESGNFGPWGKNSYEQKGAGSGIIVSQNDSELLILTNDHVVDGATKLSVKFIDDTNVEAYIKGTDSTADLAIVAIPLKDIKESTLKAIKTATLGDSNELKVGQGVIAIGNALGYGQSVTVGVVSALNREVQSSDNETKKLIQTDAAINGGNSGGALIDSEGKVIGINEAKYSSNSSSQSSIEGMGFSIPVSSAIDVINNLMNQETKKKVAENERGYLGITGADVSQDVSSLYGAPQGVIIASILDGGAAQKAGLSKADIITELNGTKITSMTQLKEQLEYYKIGNKVKLKIYSLDGNKYVEKSIEVTLQKQVETSNNDNSNNDQNNNQENSGNDIFGK